MKLALRAAPPALVHRTFALDDIAIRSGGSGRIVDAYAAVFDIEVSVSDAEGRYREVIRSGAFERTIAQRAGRMQVIYNHGLDLYGKASAAFSMPIGKTLEMREDGRGLRTSTEYANTPLADEVLTLIRDGVIRGQSFGGAWIRSNPQRGPYRADQLVERTEIAIREYGPTPFPVYADADMIGVRSLTDIVADLETMSDEDKAELARILGTNVTAPAGTGTGETDPPDPGTDTVPAATHHDLELDLLKAKLAHEGTNP